MFSCSTCFQPMGDIKRTRVTQTIRSSGCGFKIGPGDLTEALPGGITLISHPNLIMGMERVEDAVISSEIVAEPKGEIVVR